MTALTGLPQILPAETQLRTDLLAALNGLEAGGELLAATIAAHPPKLAWFVCAAGLSFALERLAGEPLHLRAADGVRAAECLERAEPVLRAIEWALDLELEPETLAETTPNGKFLWLCVQTWSGSSPGGRIHLAIPPDLRLIAAPAPLAPRLIEDVPFPVRLTLTGPRLAPMEAAALATGDLLLLGEAPLGASIRFLHRPTVAGLYAPTERRFTPCHSQE